MMNSKTQNWALKNNKKIEKYQNSHDHFTFLFITSLNAIDTSVERRPIQLHYEVKEIGYADRNMGQTNHFIPFVME